MVKQSFSGLEVLHVNHSDINVNTDSIINLLSMSKKKLDFV